MGNHEHAVVHGPYLFNANASKAIEWTWDQFSGGAKMVAPVKLSIDLPVRLEVEELLLVHGLALRIPVMEYVSGATVGVLIHKDVRNFADWALVLCWAMPARFYRPLLFVSRANLATALLFQMEIFDQRRLGRAAGAIATRELATCCLA